MIIALLPAAAARSGPGEDIRRAEGYLRLSQYDDALLLLDSILATFTEQDRRSSAQALTARLRRAWVFERTERLDTALNELFALAEASESAGAPAITAEAYLLVALIYEKAERFQRCRTYLYRARRVIQDNDLEPLRSMLAIRTASYHRLNGDPYRAKLFARRALAFAARSDQPYEIATAHLVLSLLYRNDDLVQSQYHLKEAARTYRKVGNPIDYMVVMLNLANVQYRSGQFERALATNDSVLNVFRDTVTHKGAEAYAGPAYQYRARVLRALGRHDSAYHYLDVGHQKELQYLRKVADSRILQIEAEFNEEKNGQLIVQQEQQIAVERRRKLLVTGLMAVALGALIFLGYGYRKLRGANRELARRSKTIQSKNQQLADSLSRQRLLQSEVHHRVRNNLQIVISLLDLQREEITDETQQHHLESLAGRVYSMAAIHEVLYQEGKANAVNMQQYVEKLCHYFDQLYSADCPAHYTLDMGDCALDLETAVPLATILNELLTNSFKYADPEGTQLRISISLRQTGPTIELYYRDNGTGYPQGTIVDRAGGLGNYLLRGMSRQLKGSLRTFNDGGAVAVVTFRRKEGFSAILSQPEGEKETSTP